MKIWKIGRTEFWNFCNVVHFPHLVIFVPLVVLFSLGLLSYIISLLLYILICIFTDESISAVFSDHLSFNFSSLDILGGMLFFTALISVYSAYLTQKNTKKYIIILSAVYISNLFIFIYVMLSLASMYSSFATEFNDVSTLWYESYVYKRFVDFVKQGLPLSQIFIIPWTLYTSRKWLNYKEKQAGENLSLQKVTLQI
jgi:hypothetical protein